MIVLWGVPGDGPLDAVTERLSHIGVPFRVANQRRSAVHTIAPSNMFDAAIADGDGGTFKVSEIRAMYVRPIEADAVRGGGASTDVDALLQADRLDRLLVAWADLSDGLVVNRPAAMAENNSKPFQLGRIRQYGFDVPATLITTDPEALRVFASAFSRVIYKSISGVRSIVSSLDMDDHERFGDVANAPTQFQEWIPGTDFRVHVVGEAAFATEVRSGADDYRYPAPDEAVDLSSAHLPPAVLARCREMTAGMGLAVSGIDLRHTPDDRWICFEVNPSPAFTFYEDATGQPIADAIAALLADADR